MSLDNSVTTWIQGLKGGDESAANRIWERFFHRVCGLADQRLGSTPRTELDSEDVALSAIHALCKGAQSDRFKRLEDRSDLWDILAMITIRKSVNARRRAGVRSRESSAEASDLDLLPNPMSLEGVIDDQYMNLLCATGEEMVERLDMDLRQVAVLRLEGYSNGEIAEHTQCSVPTVERQLRKIRDAWRAGPSVTPN